jgi:uncharacterized membrane protein
VIFAIFTSLHKGMWQVVMSAFKTFRSYFARGLAALLPTIATIWIFFQCYGFVQEHISGHINRGVVRVIVLTVDYYPSLEQDQVRTFVLKNYPALQGDEAAIAAKMQDKAVLFDARVIEAEKYWVNGPGQITGFILAVIGVCFLGAFLASVVGRSLWRLFEKAVVNTPLISRVYPHIKQITDMVLKKKDKSEFNHVVAIQYPRLGVWSIALVTGTGLRKLSTSVSKDFLTVFIPSSPTPFTGYVIMTPKDEVIELDMTVEEALRFTVSGGVITPKDFQESQNKSGE